MSRLWVEATWEHSKKVVVCKSKRESSMLVPWSQTSTLQMYEKTNFCCSSHPDYLLFVQLLSHVRPFPTPWTAAYQASLSFTISSSLLRFMSIQLVMLTFSSSVALLSFCLQSFPQMYNDKYLLYDTIQSIFTALKILYDLLIHASLHTNPWQPLIFLLFP